MGGMSGINYVLDGAVQHRAMDIVDVVNTEQGRFVGIKHAETRVAQDEVMVTLPHKQNIHGFTATENTAVLQILVPDYDHKERVCSYWEVDEQLDAAIKHKCKMEIEK